MIGHFNPDKYCMTGNVCGKYPCECHKLSRTAKMVLDSVAEAREIENARYIEKAKEGWKKVIRFYTRGGQDSVEKDIQGPDSTWGNGI